MSKVPIWRRYLRFFGPDLPSDIDEELRFHLETKARELMEQGLTPEAASRQAALHFGNAAEVSAMCHSIAQEHSRRAGLRDTLGAWLYDLKHAARGLLRSPKFAFVVIATLADAAIRLWPSITR